MVDKDLERRYSEGNLELYIKNNIVFSKDEPIGIGIVKNGIIYQTNVLGILSEEIGIVKEGVPILNNKKKLDENQVLLEDGRKVVIVNSEVYEHILY
jgi:hypothetical protein